MRHNRDTFIPKEGSKVWVQGHEFIARNVTVSEGVLRFKGICSDHPANASIRNTGYNGGTYGWNIRQNA